MRGGQRQRVPGAPPLPTFTTASGTFRETCSCGGTIEVPATTAGSAEIREWRHMHRHQPPLPSPSQSSSTGELTDSADRPHATTGEIRDNDVQDVPFGFFPPIVEARRP